MYRSDARAQRLVSERRVLKWPKKLDRYKPYAGGLYLLKKAITAIMKTRNKNVVVKFPFFFGGFGDLRPLPVSLFLPPAV